MRHGSHEAWICAQPGYSRNPASKWASTVSGDSNDVWAMAVRHAEQKVDASSDPVAATTKAHAPPCLPAMYP
eukprot:scaffold6550_cov131-Isochrysis_galbana.AAC.14